MRILHVGKFYPPHMGGTEIYTHQLVEKQAQSEHVRVIVASDSKRTVLERRDDATIVRLATFGSVASMPITPTMWWHILRSKADVIHMHMPNPAAAAAYLTSGNRAPLILTHHADTVGREFLKKLSQPVVDACMRKAFAIIVTSKTYLETSTELKVFRDKCRVIPLGIDAAQFTRKDDGIHEEVTRRYGPRLMICIGRLVPFKGFECAVRAMQRVDGNLLILGEGPLEVSLRRLAQELGLADRVHFVGSIPNTKVPGYLAASTAFVFPSIARTESFGIVQLEAMAMGVPVINTSLGTGVSEVSVDGLTGLTVPPGDWEALGRAMNRLFDNPNLCREFGAHGRFRVASEYSLSLMQSKTISLYEEAHAAFKARLSP